MVFFFLLSFTCLENTGRVTTPTGRPSSLFKDNRAEKRRSTQLLTLADSTCPHAQQRGTVLRDTVFRTRNVVWTVARAPPGTLFTSLCRKTKRKNTGAGVRNMGTQRVHCSARTAFMHQFHGQSSEISVSLYPFVSPRWCPRVLSLCIFCVEIEFTGQWRHSVGFRTRKSSVSLLGPT